MTFKSIRLVTTEQLTTLVHNWINGDNQQQKDELHFFILSTLLTLNFPNPFRKQNATITTPKDFLFLETDLTVATAEPAVSHKDVLTRLIRTGFGQNNGRLDLRKTGDPYYFCQIGYHYELGVCGCPKDSINAIKFYEKAIAKNSVVAMLRRAALYQQGVGGPINKAAALCLLLEAYTRANDTLRIDILPMIAPLITSTVDLKTALTHYPHTELCLENIPLTADAEQVLLTTVLRNDKITSLTPAEFFRTAPPALKRLYQTLRARSQKEPLDPSSLPSDPLQRHDWSTQILDTLYQGWLTSEPTQSGQLFYLLQHQQIDPAYIQRYENDAQQAFDDNNDNPRLTLLTLIAKADKPANEHTLRYLAEQIAQHNDTDAMTLRAIYHLKQNDYTLAGKLLITAANKGNQYANYLLTTRVYGTRAESNPYRKSNIALLQILFLQHDAGTLFAEALSEIQKKLADISHPHHELVTFLNGFTGTTLRLAQHTKPHFSSEYESPSDGYTYDRARDYRRELLAAILQNYAITEITSTPNLLAYHTTEEQAQVATHLARNRAERTEYQSTIAQIRQHGNWDDCIKLKALIRAYHYGDQKFIDEAFSRMSPALILTLGQHGPEAPNDNKLIGIEPAAKRFGHLQALRKRINEEAIFLQMSHYLEKKSRERGADGRFQERLTNYAKILSYLSEHCHGNTLTIDNLIRFIDALDKVAVSNSFFARSKETYHHLRDLLKTVPLERLVERYKEHENDLLARIEQPFIGTLLQQINENTELAQAATKKSVAATITQPAEKLYPDPSAPAAVPSTAPTGLFESFKSFWIGKAAPAATSPAVATHNSTASSLPLGGVRVIPTAPPFPASQLSNMYTTNHCDSSLLPTSMAPIPYCTLPPAANYPYGSGSGLPPSFFAPSPYDVPVPPVANHSYGWPPLPSAPPYNPEMTTSSNNDYYTTTTTSTSVSNPQLPSSGRGH